MVVLVFGGCNHQLWWHPLENAPAQVSAHPACSRRILLQAASLCMDNVHITIHDRISWKVMSNMVQADDIDSVIRYGASSKTPFMSLSDDVAFKRIQLLRDKPVTFQNALIPSGTIPVGNLSIYYSNWSYASKKDPMAEAGAARQQRTVSLRTGAPGPEEYPDLYKYLVSKDEFLALSSQDDGALKAMYENQAKWSVMELVWDNYNIPEPGRFDDIYNLGWTGCGGGPNSGVAKRLTQFVCPVNGIWKTTTAPQGVSEAACAATCAYSVTKNTDLIKLFGDDCWPIINLKVLQMPPVHDALYPVDWAFIRPNHPGRGLLAFEAPVAGGTHEWHQGTTWVFTNISARPTGVFEMWPRFNRKICDIALSYYSASDFTHDIGFSRDGAGKHWETVRITVSYHTFGDVENIDRLLPECHAVAWSGFEDTPDGWDGNAMLGRLLAVNTTETEDFIEYVSPLSQKTFGNCTGAWGFDEKVTCPDMEDYDANTFITNCGANAVPIYNASADAGWQCHSKEYMQSHGSACPPSTFTRCDYLPEQRTFSYDPTTIPYYNCDFDTSACVHGQRKSGDQHCGIHSDDFCICDYGWVGRWCDKEESIVVVKSDIDEPDFTYVILVDPPYLPLVTYAVEADGHIAVDFENTTIHVPLAKTSCLSVTTGSVISVEIDHGTAYTATSYQLNTSTIADQWNTRDNLRVLTKLYLRGEAEALHCNTLFSKRQPVLVTGATHYTPARPVPATTTSRPRNDNDNDVADQSSTTTTATPLPGLSAPTWKPDTIHNPHNHINVCAILRGVGVGLGAATLLALQLYTTHRNTRPRHVLRWVAVSLALTALSWSVCDHEPAVPNIDGILRIPVCGVPIKLAAISAQPILRPHSGGLGAVNIPAQGKWSHNKYLSVNIDDRGRVGGYRVPSTTAIPYRGTLNTSALPPIKNENRAVPDRSDGHGHRIRESLCQVLYPSPSPMFTHYTENNILACDPAEWIGIYCLINKSHIIATCITARDIPHDQII